MTKQKKNSRWQGYDPRYIYSLVVRRYFADMKTKIEIAEELGVSRFKVARLIDEAIEQEYVRFIFPKQQAMDEEGNDSNLLIVFYVQIMPDDFVMQLHRF